MARAETPVPVVSRATWAVSGRAGPRAAEEGLGGAALAIFDTEAESASRSRLFSGLAGGAGLTGAGAGIGFTTFGVGVGIGFGCGAAFGSGAGGVEGGGACGTGSSASAVC